MRFIISRSSLFREVHDIESFVISRGSGTAGFAISGGSLYRKVRYIARFIISGALLYRKVRYKVRYISRFVISRVSLCRELRYIARLVVSKSSLYRREVRFHYSDTSKSAKHKGQTKQSLAQAGSKLLYPCACVGPVYTVKL